MLCLLTGPVSWLSLVCWPPQCPQVACWRLLLHWPRAYPCPQPSELAGWLQHLLLCWRLLPSGPDLSQQPPDSLPGLPHWSQQLSHSHEPEEHMMQNPTKIASCHSKPSKRFEMCCKVRNLGVPKDRLYNLLPCFIYNLLYILAIQQRSNSKSRGGALNWMP